MKPIFERGPSLSLRLFLALVASAGLITLDQYTNSSAQLRSFLTASVSPLFYLANLPQDVMFGASEQFKSHQKILEENQVLKNTVLLQNGQLQRLQFLQQENDKLRALLGAQPVSEGKRLIAEVLAVYSHPFSHQIVLNKGSNDGVSVGQPLLDDLGVLGQVVSAVEFLFLFTLAAGLVVLFAAVTATREERAREYAVLRALGASNQLLARVQRAELAGIGALAGLLATGVALLMGWGLARFAFEFEWTASPWVPLLGAIVGAVLALAAGWWGLRDVLHRPVVQTLRQAS